MEVPWAALYETHCREGLRRDQAHMKIVRAGIVYSGQGLSLGPEDSPGPVHLQIFLTNYC